MNVLDQTDAMLDAPTRRRCGVFVCRHGVPARLEHDCDYTDARDSLIPYAEQMATADTAGMQSWPDDERQRKWDQRFHYHMDRLAEAARAMLGSEP
ncbi:MAG TPA: hypothetical protein VF841_17280 [Anaeromyxobacter sp.]